jgi:polyvinyl alcohol dehydrogenase (cytochrome)
MGKLTRWFVAAVVVAVGLIGIGPAAADPGDSNWTSAGQNLENTRYQSTEKKIKVGNVAQLGVAWAFTTDGDVSATPAVDGSKVYVPDWAGNLYAVDRKTGVQVWKTTISDATGVFGDKARATPVISGNKVIVGTQGNLAVGGGGGKLLAYDKNTGAPLWQTTLDTHFGAIVTQSAVVHGNRVYVGVASLEEAIAAFIPGYVCCTFRGSMLALDVNTGRILWKTYMVPDGYSGGAIWGSSPAIDTRRGQVYIADGNNYSIPADAQACVLAAGTDEGKQRACIAPDDHFDSIVALDLKTGAIRWATAALPFDAWTVACIFGGGPNCPQPAGPDYDFGQGPALFTVDSPGRGKHRDLVGAGQKSGQYWALDPDTGAVRWVTVAGPGGTAGGLQWGSAVDGKRVYTADSNSNNKPWEMPDGSVVMSGMWSGLDAATGKLLWQTAPPDGGSSSGPVTTANGVVFGCTINPLDPQGHMYAMNAATGAVLWHFPSEGSCLSGAAISNGTVFWGSGYSNFGFGTPGHKLYAFQLP